MSQASRTQHDTEIFFATGNPLKYREARSLCPPLKQFECDLAEIQAVDVQRVVEAKIEDLKTLRPRRRIIVEDTGLEIPTLGGLPGALVKWFLSAVGSSGLADLALRDAAHTPATAVSAVAALDRSNVKVWVGRTEGSIVRPRGEDFGWNSIFEPTSSDMTFGEMSPEQRLSLSMRRQPILSAVAWLGRE